MSKDASANAQREALLGIAAVMRNGQNAADYHKRMIDLSLEAASAAIAEPFDESRYEKAKTALEDLATKLAPPRK